MMLAWGLIEFPQVSHGLDLLLGRKSMLLGNPSESLLRRQPGDVLLWHLQCNGRHSYAESLLLHVWVNWCDYANTTALQPQQLLC